MSACAATGASTTPRPDPALAAPLRPLLAAGRPTAVAYSGGRDSTALLQVARALAAEVGVPLHALHVHHGLSRDADAWQAHAAERCAAWGVRFHTTRVQVTAATGEGVEAEARRLRYAALASLARAAGCEQVLLAHHADDQAETLLLQALRGAGIAGLAAMPADSVREGLAWHRPWLAVRRSQLAQHLHDQGIDFVEDGSNADPRHARNRLRLGPLPALEAAFPGAVEALGQVAQHAQEALECLRALAEQDLAAVQLEAGAVLDVARWAMLAPARRSLVLRTWLAERTGAPAPRRLVERLLAELRPGAPPGRWPGPGGGFVAAYRDRLRWAAGGEAAAPTGSPTGRLLIETAAGDRVEMRPAAAGVPLRRLTALSWRPRRGGEQFLLHPRGVPRSLKKCFQAAGVPAWQRDAPLLYAGEALLFVPALGLDARHLSDDGPDLMALCWVPRQAG
jgi:tRNA(Ile)-lysidine synthase